MTAQPQKGRGGKVPRSAVSGAPRAAKSTASPTPKSSPGRKSTPAKKTAPKAPSQAKGATKQDGTPRATKANSEHKGASRRRLGDGSIEFRVTGRYAELLDGTLSVEDLDFEELARLQLKDKNGRFTGRPPKYLPADIVKRMRNEFFKRGDGMFAENYERCIQVMVDLATRSSTEDATRFRAAQYVIERVRGKIPDRVEITADEKAWQTAMAQVFVRRSEAVAAGDVVDAEIVEEEGL